MSRTSITSQMVGKQFGALTIIATAPSLKRPYGSGTDSQVVCRCLCGTESTVIWRNLRSGNTKSCGCRIFHRKLQKAS